MAKSKFDIIVNRFLKIIPGTEFIAGLYTNPQKLIIIRQNIPKDTDPLNDGIMELHNTMCNQCLHQDRSIINYHQIVCANKEPCNNLCGQETMTRKHGIVWNPFKRIYTL